MPKMTKADRQQLVLKTLTETITAEGTTWAEIDAAVTALNVVKENGWMEVRGLIQHLLNTGKIKRAPFDPAGDETYMKA